MLTCGSGFAASKSNNVRQSDGCPPAANGRQLQAMAQQARNQPCEPRNTRTDSARGVWKQDSRQVTGDVEWPQGSASQSGTGCSREVALGGPDTATRARLPTGTDNVAANRVNRPDYGCGAGTRSGDYWVIAAKSDEASCTGAGAVVKTAGDGRKICAAPAGKHFSRVLMQQGRVQLDADSNEAR